jgi:hypothetical protein
MHAGFFDVSCEGVWRSKSAQDFHCGGCQSHRMSRAIKQARADPFLQDLDKGELADGAALCRA